MSHSPETAPSQAARATFSEKSDQYAAARPQYPPELFEWLAGCCPRQDVAWDCAAGNGQAAVSLSPYFGKILATDVSAEQIAHGVHRENIVYSVGTAEESGFPDQTFDLVAVAQALHWFDYSRFWPEVARVTREGAAFCAWGYDWPDTVAEVDAGLVAPFRSIIAPYWAPNNKLLWDGYRPEDVGFPFPRLATPQFTIRLQWSLGELLDYMMTWSAFKRSCFDVRARAAMDDLLARSRVLVATDRVVPVSMTLKMIAGRIHPVQRPI